MNRSSAERGSTTLELAIIFPATLLVLSSIALSGLVALAQQALQAVAFDTARAASLARTTAEASSTAETVASLALTTNALSCATRSISLDTTDLTKAAGSFGSVSATITCTVKMGDLALPGIPGTVTLHATATSPVDPYRER